MIQNAKPTRKIIPAQVIGDLAAEFQKSTQTIYRWAATDHLMLTTTKARKVFAKHNFVWETDEVLESEGQG